MQQRYAISERRGCQVTARTPNDGRLDLDAVAALTAGYVGWDLENVVKKAALRAIEAGRGTINQQDLVAAVPLVKAWLTPEMSAGYRRMNSWVLDRISSRNCWNIRIASSWDLGSAAGPFWSAVMWLQSASQWTLWPGQSYIDSVAIMLCFQRVGGPAHCRGR